jgi:hypothetical protein
MGTEQPGAIGIGYAGKSLEQLATELTELEVTTLVARPSRHR